MFEILDHVRCLVPPRTCISIQSTLNPLYENNLIEEINDVALVKSAVLGVQPDGEVSDDGQEMSVLDNYSLGHQLEGIRTVSLLLEDRTSDGRFEIVLRSLQREMRCNAV